MFERRCCVERHKPAATRYIELPSDPHKSVALAHEEAVAEIGLVGWIGHLRSAVELLDDILAVSAFATLRALGLRWLSQTRFASCGVTRGGMSQNCAILSHFDLATQGYI